MFFGTPLGQGMTGGPFERVLRRAREGRPVRGVRQPLPASRPDRRPGMPNTDQVLPQKCPSRDSNPGAAIRAAWVNASSIHGAKEACWLRELLQSSLTSALGQGLPQEVE